DEGVGLGGVIGDFHAAFQERAEHDFGVHKVLGTAQRNQADPQWSFNGRFFRHRWVKLRETPGGVENYLATELAVFVSTVSGALVGVTVAGAALVATDSGGSCS